MIVRRPLFRFWLAHHKAVGRDSPSDCSAPARLPSILVDEEMPNCPGIRAEEERICFVFLHQISLLIERGKRKEEKRTFHSSIMSHTLPSLHQA